MGLFDFFHKKKMETTKEKPKVDNENHLVVIQFFYGIEDLNELHELEKQLDSNIKTNSLGKYDGHDISLDFGDGYLYFNGENADQIFQSIKPILEQH